MLKSSYDRAVNGSEGDSLRLRNVELILLSLMFSSVAGSLLAIMNDQDAQTREAKSLNLPP